MRHLTSIVIFARVAEAGSLAAAAQELGVSKPTVSKHLSALEDHLQTRLLQRSTRGVKLTASGRRFFDRCRTVLASLEEAETEAAETSAAPRGPLKVVAPHCIARPLLIPQLPRFLLDFPAIALDLRCLESPVEAEAAEFDLAVQILERVPSGYASLHLARCPQVLCAAPGYLDRAGAPETPEDLRDHACLTWGEEPGAAWRLDGPRGRETLDLAPLARMNSADALRTMALEGCGIALAPGFLVQDDLAAGGLLQVLPGYSENSREIRALFAEGPRLSKKVEVFLDYLRPRILPRQSAA